jgi:hypothetical protein
VAVPPPQATIFSFVVLSFWAAREWEASTSAQRLSRAPWCHRKGSQRRRTSPPAFARVSCAVALFLLLGFSNLWAVSRSPAQTTTRSSRADSRLLITPRDIKLAASQSQRFAVTDANGQPVAVHWDLSGIDCSGSSCGTIAEDGTYTAPHAYSGSQVVVLEGVLVSDPKHSVLTRIQLTPAPTKAQNLPAVQPHAESAKVESRKVESPKVDPATTTPGILKPTQVHSQVPQVNTAINAPLSPLRDDDDDDDVVATAVVGADPASSSLKPAALKPPEPPAPVTYRSGQLTIDVNNVTLSAVLALVSEKTGAVIEVPPGSGMEPVVGHFGPGEISEVLTQLLHGSPFNFIIVSSPIRPSEPAQVLLSLKQESEPAAEPVPAAAPEAVAATEAEEEPAEAPAVRVAPQQASNAKAAKDALAPEVVEQMMKDRAKSLRDNAQAQSESQ